MEQWIESLGWKKLVAILIVASIIFLIFIVLSISRPQNTSSLPLPSGNQGSESANHPASSFPKPTTISNPWLRYQGSLFQLNYPPDLSADPRIAQGSRESLILRSSTKNVTINIQSYEPSQTSVAKISNIFSTLGYKQNPIYISGLSGNEFSGSVLINSNRVWEKAVVFENSGAIYKLQLAYTSSAQDFSIEQIFDQIASSFHLL